VGLARSLSAGDSKGALLEGDRKRYHRTGYRGSPSLASSMTKLLKSLDFRAFDDKTVLLRAGQETIG